MAKVITLDLLKTYNDLLKDDLKGYVQKDGGKVLSSNDFTDEMASKLLSIEEEAQKNKIEQVSINDEIVQLKDDRLLKLQIPKDVKDLNDGGEYVTKKELDLAFYQESIQPVDENDIESLFQNG